MATKNRTAYCNKADEPFLTRRFPELDWVVVADVPPGKGYDSSGRLIFTTGLNGGAYGPAEGWRVL